MTLEQLQKYYNEEFKKAGFTEHQIVYLKLVVKHVFIAGSQDELKQALKRLEDKHE